MKGICFIEPLHGKTVKNIKVQTRRLVVSRTGFFQVCSKNGVVTNIWQTDANEWTGENLIPVKSRYKVGDILYLKEPYCIGVNGCDTLPSLIYYKYNEKDMSFLTRTGLINDIKWKNKLFMPASAARHFIKITAVRAERLQDISNEDCIKEGIIPVQTDDGVVYQWRGTIGPRSAWIRTPKSAYACLIDSIDGKGTWDNNPWVWVYDYELIDRKEVQL